MNRLLSLAALLASDAGNGGGGSSVLTQNAGDAGDGGRGAGSDSGGGGEKADVQTSGQGGKGAGGAELTEQQKAEAAAKAALEAPVDDKTTFKAPDGQKFDDEALKEAREFFKKHGFKAGQAQAALEFQLVRDARLAKASDEAFAKQRESWRASLKKDPEFGGAKYEQSLRHVQRAMAKYGGSDAFKKFADAGAGDHPEFVKFVAAIGADLAEDPGVRGGGKPANGASAEEAEFRKMFDNSPELFSN